MTSNQLKHQAKLREWAQAIQECRSSGLSVKAWCRNREITATTYYRWERQILTLADEHSNKSQQLATTATFAELPAPRTQCHTIAQQAATVRINDVAIDIYPGMDAEMLKMLLETMRLC